MTDEELAKLAKLVAAEIAKNNALNPGPPALPYPTQPWNPYAPPVYPYLQVWCNV